jgi:hypothetical protein
MDPELEMDSSGVEFASIDELLDGDEEEEEEDEIPEPPTFRQENPTDITENLEEVKSETTSLDVKTDDVKTGPEEEEPELLLEDNLEDEIEAEVVPKKEPASYPPLKAEQASVFASSLLDDMISQKELQGALSIKPNSALEGKVVRYVKNILKNKKKRDKLIKLLKLLCFRF